jgi:hypothetical protein
LASLDAPTVAVVWMLSFAWAADARLAPWAPLLLALAAWVLYVGDRLLDARAGLTGRATGELRQRHYFHWRHRRILVPLAIAASCAAACIVITLMPPAAQERNSMLAAATLVYFTRVHSGQTSSSFLSSLRRPFSLKELLVAILFTAACTLPVLSKSSTAAHGPLLAAAAFFALLAWLNCHAIDYWESTRPNERSGGIFRWTRPFAAACALAPMGLLLAAIVGIFDLRIAALIATGTVSSLLLAALDRLRDRLTPLALRTAADLVLLTPMALIFPALLRG